MTDAVFPAVVENGGRCDSLQAACAWLAETRESHEAQLAVSGAVLFRGFPIATAEDFDAFSAVFGYTPFTYEDSLSNAVRINFTKRVFTANEAPKDVDIFLHHEMAQTPISPSRLFFCCISAAERGGATPLCRSDRLFSSLEEQHPELAEDFRTKGLCYTTTMPGEDDHASGQGRSWRSTLSVDDRTQAEEKLASLGYSWIWEEGGSLRATTPALPAVRDLGDGSASFYNQLIAAYLGWQGVREDPSSALSFGDGTPIDRDGLEAIVELAPQHTYDLQWQDGDVALVDNHRVMHGRRAFSGDRPRQVLVAMGA